MNKVLYILSLQAVLLSLIFTFFFMPQIFIVVIWILVIIMYGKYLFERKVNKINVMPPLTDLRVVCSKGELE